MRSMAHFRFVAFRTLGKAVDYFPKPSFWNNSCSSLFRDSISRGRRTIDAIQIYRQVNMNHETGHAMIFPNKGHPEQKLTTVAKPIETTFMHTRNSVVVRTSR